MKKTATFLYPLVVLVLFTGILAGFKHEDTLTEEEKQEIQERLVEKQEEEEMVVEE
ncbi:hypothetical protein [Alteribacter aurantiacus]|uniref:hypothetical protein n=1 Tax=Alteribacter aurantiacus TaxID=254410 RepID=UPI0004025714|nr:hypothetical protein [Alteribacter aurantiacus]